jgi:hypothetical protein
MNTFRKFMEMKDDEEQSFFNQLGLDITHKGLQIKMELLDVEAIKDKLENWTKFKEIKDEEKKEKIRSMLYKPTKSLNDIYKLLIMDEKELRS